MTNLSDSPKGSGSEDSEKEKGEQSEKIFFCEEKKIITIVKIVITKIIVIFVIFV